MKDKHLFKNSAFATIGLLATVTACSGPDSRSEPLPTSGLLQGNYALLRPGGDDEARLRYDNPEADWTSYHQVSLEPVTFWEAERSAFGDLSVDQRRQLATILYQQIRNELAKDYRIARDPGAGVLHVEVELTGAAGGGASVEAQVFDGASGELLAAAVDRRVLTVSAADSSGEVLAIFELWAKRFRHRLCSARDGRDCEPPEA